MSTYKYQPMADPPQAEGSLNKLKYSGNKTPVTRGYASGPCPDLRKERTPQKFFFASLPTFYACRVNMGQAEELVRGLISWISNHNKGGHDVAQYSHSPGHALDSGRVNHSPLGHHHPKFQEASCQRNGGETFSASCPWFNHHADRGGIRRFGQGLKIQTP